MLSGEAGEEKKAGLDRSLYEAALEVAKRADDTAAEGGSGGGVAGFGSLGGGAGSGHGACGASGIVGDGAELGDEGVHAALAVGTQVSTGRRGSGAAAGMWRGGRADSPVAGR